MRITRIIFWSGGTFAALVGLVFGYYNFILDWHARPVCHKLIMFALTSVMHTSGGNVSDDPKPFPNVKGLSQDSLATISDGMGGYRAWTNDYNYVPGLREDDPPDLVLMYFNHPTRWNWHGAAPTVFNKYAWIIIPVDFTPRTGQKGECSERISLDEFRTRLSRTLDFIRTNERPNWKTIVAEHQKFLTSMEHDKR